VAFQDSAGHATEAVPMCPRYGMLASIKHVDKVTSRNEERLSLSISYATLANVAVSTGNHEKGRLIITNTLSASDIRSSSVSGLLSDLRAI
jgi:hypothetical protein